MVSIGPLSPSPVSPHASSTTAFKPAVPTPPQAPTQTPTGTGTTGTGPLAPHFNGSRNDAVAAMTDRAHTALFGNLGQQALAAVTRGPDFSADHALTALRFENRDAFAEMAERHDHAGQRRIAGEVAEVLVQTFTRDGISGVFGYHMMSRGQQDSLLAHAMAAALDEDQIIRSEDRGGYMPASTRNPHTASPQTPERDPFEHAVPDLGPTTGGSENPLGISPQNTRPVEFREFPDQSPIRETPTPSPEQVAAEAELAREALLREGEAGALQEEVGAMHRGRRAVIVDGRARDAIRDEERNLRGGGGLNFETGPLTDPASIAQLFGNLRERADASRADGRADIADAIMRQLSERYRDFAGQAGGGVQGPDSVRDGSGAGGGLLRELEEASRRTGRPLEELVRERAEELRAAGQGEQALELQRAFAHAYPNLAGPTGGRANAPVESSAELNRIRQTDPQELAGEINGAGDLSGYHEEELKAIMLRLLGAQSGSEDITAALERIGRAAPQVANAMAQERFSTEAALIFEMMNLAEISQRIDEKLIAILRDPQSAIESFTPDESAAVQRLMSQHYPELQSPEDIARFLIQMFVNPVSGLKNANALPLVAQEGHHLIVAEFGGGKSVNETLSHKHGDDFIAGGMAEIARVVTEAGGQVLHPNGATAVLVLSPDNVEATLERLDEVFRDLAIGTGDIGPGGEVFKPGIAWFDTGAITDTSIPALEEQFARGRREIDDVKAGRVEEGLYPARGSDVFEPYNPEIHSNVRPLEGTADVPPTGARNAQNEPIRREYDAALEAIRAMPNNEQGLLTQRLIEERFTHATGILNGAASLEAPRDADGRVPEGYVHAQGDMSKLSVLNNQLGWDVGDAAIGHLNAALEAAAAAYPDVTFQKYGGDEWEAIGPRDSAEAAVALIRQYLADVTISFPNPNNPAETWTLHGLGVQIGILDIERDSRTGRAPSDELEHTMGEDKARRGYTLDIRDEQGRPVQP